MIEEYTRRLKINPTNGQIDETGIVKSFEFKWCNIEADEADVIYDFSNLIPWKLEETLWSDCGESWWGWGVYFWNTLKNEDDIIDNWYDQFEPGKLKGWSLYYFFDDIRPKTILEAIEIVANFTTEKYVGFDNWTYKNELDPISQKAVSDILYQLFIKNQRIQKRAENVSHKSRGFNQSAWSRMVKLKHNNRCIECGDSEKLHAHHIKPYKDHPELRYDVNNGICLCQRCHNIHHKINGK